MSGLPMKASGENSQKTSSPDSDPLTRRSAPLATHAAAPRTAYQYQHLHAASVHELLCTVHNEGLRKACEEAALWPKLLPQSP